ELNRPRGKRVRFVVIQHVTHRQRQRIEVILDAEELKRVLPITVGEIALQGLETGNLPGHVPAVRHDGYERDGQPQQQASCRGWAAPVRARRCDSFTPKMEGHRQVSQSCPHRQNRKAARRRTDRETPKGTGQKYLKRLELSPDCLDNSLGSNDLLFSAEIFLKRALLGLSTSSPEIRANKPATVKVEAEKRRTAMVGQPISRAV